MKNYHVLGKSIAVVQVSAILTKITSADTQSYIYHGSENTGENLQLLHKSKLSQKEGIIKYSLKMHHRIHSREKTFYYTSAARCQAFDTVILPKVSFPALLEEHHHSRRSAQTHHAPCCQVAGG